MVVVALIVRAFQADAYRVRRSRAPGAPSASGHARLGDAVAAAADHGSPWGAVPAPVDDAGRVPPQADAWHVPPTADAWERRARG